MRLSHLLSGLGVAAILAATTQPASADFSFSDIPNPFCSVFSVGCPEPPPPPPPPPVAPVAAEPAPVKHVRKVHKKKVVKKKAAEDAAAPAPAEPAAK